MLLRALTLIRLIRAFHPTDSSANRQKSRGGLRLSPRLAAARFVVSPLHCAPHGRCTELLAGLWGPDPLAGRGAFARRPAGPPGLCLCTLRRFWLRLTPRLTAARFVVSPLHCAPHGRCTELLAGLWCPAPLLLTGCLCTSASKPYLACTSPTLWRFWLRLTPRQAAAAIRICER